MKNIWKSQTRAGSQIQSIIFKNRYWTTDRAKKWLQQHGFDGLDVDIKTDYLRFRQRDPSIFDTKSFRTIDLTKSIKAIVGIPTKIKKNPRDTNRKLTIPYIRLFTESNFVYTWSAIPIQLSTVSNVYFKLEMNLDTLHLYALNPMGMACDDIAITSKFCTFFNLPTEVCNQSIDDQIDYWNNQCAMIYFKNEPIKEMLLFGTVEYSHYYYRNGVLYLNLKIYQDDILIEDTDREVWSIAKNNTEEESLILFEKTKTQNMKIGIIRKHLQDLITRSL